MKTGGKTVDVVVVGGGIVGISTAYHLAKEESLRVLVLEKDLLVEGSTGLSVGGFRQQFSHPANIRLSQESLRQWRDLQEEEGKAPALHRVGYLFLARNRHTWADFLQGVEVQRGLGVAVETLTPEEIKKRWHFLRTDDIEGGTFGPEDGFADPYEVSMVMAARARRLGAVFEERIAVTGILEKGDELLGVTTTRGEIHCGCVVNAAGPWAGEVAAMAGLRLPVAPYRRQVFMTGACDLQPKPIPMIIDVESRHYFRGEGMGILMGMSDLDEPSSFNTHTDPEFMEDVVERLLHRAPGLGSAEILRGWAGLYAITPDENPIIGPLGEKKGFWGAIGFSGHGFQHGPAAGKILSDLIRYGRTQWDISPFRYDRFGENAEAGERRTV